MPRSLAPSSSEDDLVFEDEKIEEILRQSTPDPRQSTAVSKESSSSSKNLEDIYFRGSRPRLDSTVDTTSAPISFANDFNDSNDSIGGMRLQPFKKLRLGCKPSQNENFGKWTMKTLFTCSYLYI